MKTSIRSLTLFALALLTFSVVGCGDSDFEQISISSTTGGGQTATAPLPATQVPTAGLPVAESPDFVAGTDPGPSLGAAAGPVTARASFTFTGMSNANMTPFSASPTSIIQAGLRPNSSQATEFVFAIQNGPAAGAKRVLRLEISGGTSKLAVGNSFSADSTKSGARATIMYIDQPDAQSTTIRSFRSTGGEVVITQLKSNSATVQLKNVRFAPIPGALNTASGNPMITGEGSFTF